MRTGFSLLVVSILWFIVRAAFHMPSNTPLFPGGPFSWGDGIAVAFGVVGVILLIPPLRDFIFQNISDITHFDR